MQSHIAKRHLNIEESNSAVGFGWHIRQPLGTGKRCFVLDTALDAHLGGYMPWGYPFPDDKFQDLFRHFCGTPSFISDIFNLPAEYDAARPTGPVIAQINAPPTGVGRLLFGETYDEKTYPSFNIDLIVPRDIQLPYFPNLALHEGAIGVNMHNHGTNIVRIPVRAGYKPHDRGIVIQIPTLFPVD